MNTPESKSKTTADATPPIETPVQDLEVIDHKSEVATQKANNGDGIMDMDIATLERMGKELPRRLAVYKQFRHFILSMAAPNDWVRFTSPDGVTTVELGSAGAERLKMPMGIKFPPDRIKITREDGEDGGGQWFLYTVTCVAVWNGTEQMGIGFAGSRTKFFGSEAKDWKPLDKITQHDVQMAAIHNAQKEAIKQIFGIRRITQEEAISLGLRPDAIRGHTFVSGGGQRSAISDQPADKTGRVGTRMAAPPDVEHGTVTGRIVEVVQPKKSTLVVMEDNERFSTFDKDIIATAKRLCAAKTTVRVYHKLDQWRSVLRIEEATEEDVAAPFTGAGEANSKDNAGVKPAATVGLQKSAWELLEAELNMAHAEDLYSVTGSNTKLELKAWKETDQNATAQALIKKRIARNAKQ